MSSSSIKKLTTGVLLTIFCCSSFSDPASLNKLDEAEKAMSSLKTWDDLNNWRMKFSPRYEDGYVGEGIAEFVSTKLATEWSTLPEVLVIESKSPGFEAFVVNWVTEMTECDQNIIIATNATKNCPADAKEFCAKINAQAHIGAVPECLP